MGHGAEMQIDDVANIDEAEADLRAAGQGAVHQALHDEDGGRVVWAEYGAEDGDRVDDGELEAAAFFGDEVPRGAFGEGLGFWIGGDFAGTGEV